LAKPRFWRQSQVIIQVEEWPVRIRPDSVPKGNLERELAENILLPNGAAQLSCFSR